MVNFYFIPIRKSITTSTLKLTIYPQIYDPVARTKPLKSTTKQHPFLKNAINRTAILQITHPLDYPGVKSKQQAKTKKSITPIETITQKNIG